MRLILESQHAEMRQMLEQLRQYENLTFRSEKVPLLLSEFLFCVYQHFKSERTDLASAFESEEDKAAYDAHYLSVLESISEILFALILNQDTKFATVLPQMENWVVSHEALHSHLCLPIH